MAEGYEAKEVGAKEESMQRKLETALQNAIMLRRSQPERVNALLCSELISCDAEEKTAVFRFPVQGWELNPAGNLHGGISASMMDVSMGMLATAFSRGHMCVTTSMTMNYLRPIQENEYIIAEARAEFTGRTLLGLTAKGISEKTGKTLFTATANYMVTEMLLSDMMAARR